MTFADQQKTPAANHAATSEKPVTLEELQGLLGFLTDSANSSRRALSNDAKQWREHLALYLRDCFVDNRHGVERIPIEILELTTHSALNKYIHDSFKKLIAELHNSEGESLMGPNTPLKADFMAERSQTAQDAYAERLSKNLTVVGEGLEGEIRRHLANQSRGR